MNSTARKMDSGIIRGGDNESSSLENNLAEMNKIQRLLCYRKAFLRNSAQLKSQIHSHINDLIETLKERERQLCLEIDVYDIDCFLLMTDKNCVDNPSEEKTCLNIDEEHLKVNQSAVLEKKLKFIGNTDALKTKLQHFGKIEEVKEATYESCGCDLTQVKKSRYHFKELVKKLSKKNGIKKAHKISTGSVESFEVIDGLDLDEYQKYIQSLRDEDDIEIVSSPDETWQSSFPVYEIGYLSSPKPICNKNMILPVHITSQDESSSSDSQRSSNFEETVDPVTQIHEQLQALLHSSSNAKCQEKKVQAQEPSRNLNEMSFPSQQKPKSDGPSFKTPTPSAIIQETFNKYLDQSGSGKWLASINNEQQSKSTYDISQWLY